MDQKDDWHLTEIVDHAQGRSDPFAAAVRATRMPMIITDPRLPDNPIIFANQAFQTLTGYEKDEIIGHNCRFLQGPGSDPKAVDRIRAAIKKGEPVDVDLLNYRKDGTTFWNALYLSPVRNDADQVIYFFASLLNVTERVNAQVRLAEQNAIIEAEVKRRTAELEAALEAKSVLLHEVDHRVKNNLTMIGSLLRLQARSITDPEVTNKLSAMLERVDALATVHRRLYQSEDLRMFDVAGFATTLLADIIGVSGRTDIKVQSSGPRIDVPASHATALGLILNEVFTNAIKHAYADGRSGVLRLSTAKSSQGATIAVADDGPGIDCERMKNGLGQTLIKRLAKQAGATVEWSSGSPGTTVTIKFEGGHDQ
ncbi:MAG: hypothetical protein JWQ82_349 [Tardiphaga sp.]|nr:hypothetical protein [Tardiphaga sp.]